MTEQKTREDFFAQRVRRVGPSPTLAVSQRARELRAEGIDVIDLGGGDPDFITPEHIREAAAAAMNAGDTHYAPSAGTPQLLEAIANKLKTDNDISVNPKTDIIVTPGGKNAIYQVVMALVEPGVDVMLLEPAWVSYRPMVELAGGRAIGVPLSPDNNFAITRDLLEEHVTDGTRAILLNSPNNPTGRVATLDELTAIADFAKAHDILVLTDEMYEKIIFEDHKHISIATLPDMAERTFTFNGLSKAYAMTGWRLGYVAGPTDLMKKVMILQSHSVTCATSFAMAGGVAAYNGPQDIIHEMVAAWDRRRQLITTGLNAIKGLHQAPIEGAFYGYVDGRGTGMSIDELSQKLLNDAFVAVVPGTAFGESSTSHFRLSFATSDQLLENAIERIGKVLGYK